jgi:hypothetical protein
VNGLREVLRRVQEAAVPVAAWPEQWRRWAPELADQRVGQRMTADRVPVLRKEGLDGEWAVERERDGTFQMSCTVGVARNWKWTGVAWYRRRSTGGRIRRRRCPCGAR